VNFAREVERPLCYSTEAVLGDLVAGLMSKVRSLIFSSLISILRPASANEGNLCELVDFQTTCFPDGFMFHFLRDLYFVLVMRGCERSEYEPFPTTMNLAAAK